MSHDPRWSDDARHHSGHGRDLSRCGRGGPDGRSRERVDPRDVFVEHVALPRGREREHVVHRGREYTLRGSESRTLSSVGAFRVVPAHELRDTFDRPLDPRQGELWHLREAGLVRTVRVDRDTVVVALTKEGRSLLEAQRRDAEASRRDHQAFHDDIQRPRELKHDSALYRAYLDEAERLHEAGAEIRRVVLENDLKAEYEEFLQQRNRGRGDSDGRPDRDADEIRRWADEHHLPCDEQGHVMFPDARIEYTLDGREQALDVEVMTPHYRGAHAASKAKAGFSLSWSGRAGGRGGSARIRRGLADELAR